MDRLVPSMATNAGFTNTSSHLAAPRERPNRTQTAPKRLRAPFIVRYQWLTPNGNKTGNLERFSRALNYEWQSSKALGARVVWA